MQNLSKILARLIKKHRHYVIAVGMVSFAFLNTKNAF